LTVQTAAPAQASDAIEVWDTSFGDVSVQRLFAARYAKRGKPFLGWAIPLDVPVPFWTFSPFAPAVRIPTQDDHPFRLIVTARSDGT